MRTLNLLLACLLSVLIPLQGLAASLERVWSPAHIHVSTHEHKPRPPGRSHHKHADHYHGHAAHSHGQHAGGHAHALVDRSVIYLVGADLAALKAEAIKRFLDVILQPDSFTVLCTHRNMPIQSSYWVGYQHSSAPPERPPRSGMDSAQHG